jgi:hypothetical protein
MRNLKNLHKRFRELTRAMKSNISPIFLHFFFGADPFISSD